MFNTTPTTPNARERTRRHIDSERGPLQMRTKDDEKPIFPGSPESKPLIATLFFFSVLLVIWNFNQCHQNVLSASCGCTSAAPAAVLPSASHLKTHKLKFYGNAVALFVQMGAYRGGPNTFAVVGLASKPLHVYDTPWYKCRWYPNRNGSDPITSRSYKILPDWGYGRVYTTIVINCTFPSNPNHDNSGGKLVIYAYHSLSSRTFSKFTALEETVGSYDESKFAPPFEYDILYCGSPLYGNVSTSRVREWMAYHAWLFGSRSHFVFYDAGGVSDSVRSVLDPWIKMGRVTVQDIRDQDQFDSYYYNQFLVVNDCLHRYRYAANWTFFFDVDEYIHLMNPIQSVLDELGNYTQFTIQQNPMNGYLCLNDSSNDYSRQWGFEKLVFSNSETSTWKDKKYAIQARHAFATGVHMSFNVEGKVHHHMENKIQYYHYHNTIQVMGEPCRVFLPPSSRWKVNTFDNKPFVYDENLKKLAHTVKLFEHRTLSKLSHTRNL